MVRHSLNEFDVLDQFIALARNIYWVPLTRLYLAGA